MKTSRIFKAVFAVAFLGQAVQASDSVPGPKQTRPVAIVGGTVHTASGGTLEKATVVFAEGKITKVGTGIAVEAGWQVVDAAGKHIYPGLMDVGSTLGVAETSSVRATVDSRETGQMNPNVRIERAVNPDSEHIPVARANGVLLSITAPDGGLISGMSACLRLDGWTWEEMTVQGATGMHVSWPAPNIGGGGGGSAASDAGATPRDPLEPVRTFIATARAYQQNRIANPAAPNDTRFEAMIPVLEGKVPWVVEADTALEIASAVAFAKREKLRLIILGGQDAADVAVLLKQENVPVIINGVQRLPRRRGDPYDSAFTLPARLRDAGVKFAITSNNGAAFVRNLPYNAAMASAFGLTADEALRSITLSPAEIFGLEAKVGSLEVGKEATLFIADGDILETPTQVTQAWTAGRATDLTSKQTRLWKKYQQKYQAAGAAK